MRSFDRKRSSPPRRFAVLALFGTAALAPARASAHFMITAPANPPQPATVQSWMSEDSVGGPQKNGPCAATPNTGLGDSPGTPVANAVTVIQPGQKLTVPVTITIAHPGWFRISLAEGPSSGQTLAALPDPQAQSGTNCTPAIMSNPVWSPTQPILADGLPAGSTASTQQTGTKSFQVTIPSTAACSAARPCSLQVVMIMTDHPVGDCYYHHCADVAFASGVTDGGAVATGGSGPGTGGGTGGGAGAGTGGTTTSTPPGTGGRSGAAGQPGGTPVGSGGSTPGGSGSVSGGCSCVVKGHEPTSWAWVVIGAAALLAVRRRRPR